MEGDDDAYDEQSFLKYYINRTTSQEQSTVSQKNTMFQEKSPKTEELSKNLEFLTYSDLVHIDKDDLDYVVEHPIRYNPPIYLAKGFDRYSLRKKVEFLCSYHTRISKNIADKARLQVGAVELPKLFKVPNKSGGNVGEYEISVTKGTKVENSDLDSFFEDQTEEYISRAGRITKRKFYTESLNSELKKPKMVDKEWISPKTTNHGKKPTLSNENAIEGTNISAKNLNIMSRSALFKDKEPKNSRIVKIAKELELRNAKDKEAEKEIELFSKTLPNIDIEDTSVVETVDPVRRRVIPKKPAKYEKQKKQRDIYEQLNLSSRSGKRSPSPLVQTEKTSIKKSPVKLDVFDTLKNEASSSFSKKTPKKMMACPICDRNFAEADIEQHAADCGDNIIETRSHSSTMTCKTCDKVFLIDSEYESHVKNCSW